LTVKAQQDIDSLIRVSQNSNEPDTARLEALDILSGDVYLYSIPDSAYYFAKIQENFARNKKNKKYEVSALNTQGIHYFLKSEFALSLEAFNKSLEIDTELKNESGIAVTISNIGIIYMAQEDYDTALEYYESALEIQKKLKIEKGIANTTGNIGLIYYELGEFEKALKYHQECLEILIKLDNKMGVANTYNNIGAVYDDIENPDEAIKYYQLALDLAVEISDKGVQSVTSMNLSIKYREMGELHKAKNYAEYALETAVEMDQPLRIFEACESLMEIYNELGMYKKAFETSELYIEMEEVLGITKFKKELSEQSHEFELKFIKERDSLEAIHKEKVYQAEINAEKAETAKEKQFSYFLYGCIGLVLVFGLYILNRYQFISKQKKSIEKQKEIIEEAHSEIKDSMEYAKRIQSAILPPNKLVKEYLKESFILYKPKDIVAGDFYWIEHKEGKVLFAAADCTGHGVPGAMVSVVCNGALNRSVREFGLTDPGQILSKARDIVIEEFEKSEEEVKDGMDIALCSLEGNKLKYAGAHNSLWVIRKEGTEVEEVKADKQPIGMYAEPKPFTSHELELYQGDTFYTFSDGFADQFGGEKGKKFKSKNFKSLLLSIQNENMDRQKELIDETFEKWRGSLEQLDDVCVIGVRV
jgi:serine phosphatase RsbU (regulator of sigma subunit)/Tfp pilus assembly protein PilF